MDKIILDTYNSIRNVSQVVKTLKVTRYKVEKTLRENGLNETKKHISFNSNYFEDIDSDKKAYFLGLLAADGYIGFKNNLVSISLQEEDSYLLEEFSKELGIYKKLTFLPKEKSHYKNNYRFGIQNKKMKSDLMKLNITPRKSLTLLPPNIKPEYFKSFILGYFDGDGGFSKNIRKSKSTEYLILTATFTGTLEICNFIKNQVYLNCQIDGKIKKRFKDSKNTYTLYFFGNKQLIKIFDWLYSDSQIKMERKFLLYKHIKNHRDVKNNNRKSNYKYIRARKYNKFSYDFSHKSKKYIKYGFNSEAEALDALIAIYKEITGKDYTLF